MVEAKIRKEITIILKLSEEEALWLKGVMQNPVDGKCPSEEFKEDSDMRRAFFEALALEI